MVPESVGRRTLAFNLTLKMLETTITPMALRVSFPIIQTLNVEIGLEERQ